MSRILETLDLPPFWLVYFMLGAFAAETVAPLSLFAASPTIGWTLIGLGLALAVWAALVFAQARTPVMPRQDPQAIVTSGPYRFSRNPIYVGDALILLGWGAMLGSAWPLLATPLFLFVIQKRFVEAEEASLQASFPREWAAWAARTRRWL